MVAILAEIERHRLDDWVVWLNMTGEDVKLANISDETMAAAGLIRIAPRRELRPNP